MEQGTTSGATGAATATKPELRITRSAEGDFVLSDGQYKVALEPQGYVPEDVLLGWVNTINTALPAHFNK